MGEYDTPAIEAQDIPAAIGLLTRLPVRVDTEFAVERGAAAAWAYPIAGAVIALLSVAVAWGALWLGLGSMIAALLAVATGLITTGAMHEDGLADCADGFWGGWDSAMRLKIMKDSQIGTYGLLALLFSQAIRFGAVLEILQWDRWVLPLIALHVASRAVMPVIMSALPHARDTGLSRSVGKVSQQSAIKSALIGLGALIIAFGLAGLFYGAIAALSAFCLARLALAKISGQTGDVCGAAQQIAEVALLLAFVAG